MSFNYAKSKGVSFEDCLFRKTVTNIDADVYVPERVWILGQNPSAAYIYVYFFCGHWFVRLTIDFDDSGFPCLIDDDSRWKETTATASA